MHSIELHFKKIISVLTNIAIWLLFITMTNIISPSIIFAQANSSSTGSHGAGTLGVARMIDTKEKNVKDGSIISVADNGAILSNVAYDGQVQGVVARDAGILMSGEDDANAIPVISVGKVYILVSSIEGPIKKGDQLTTTSLLPGVAVKATKSGYVLGTALEDYASPNKKQVGKIAADLDLHYFNAKPTFPGSLTDIFKIALLPTKEGPTPLFKYIVAALVTIGSFVLGFLTFGRTAAKGVEALGRNPAASRIIHLGIIFNVAIVIVIALAGLLISFLILRL